MDIQAYTQRGRSAVQAAQSEAVTRDHQQLTPLHIMAGLMSDEGKLPTKIMALAGANPETLEAGLEKGLGKLPRVEGGAGLSLSNAGMKIFANAEKAAKKAGDAFVTVERLLLACVLNADKNLKTILTQAGLEPCLLYTSPSPRDQRGSRMPSSA